MVKVTRLDGSSLYLNAEFIQSIESTPDTHIVLVNGHSYVVTESDEEVVAGVMAYRHAAYGTGRPNLHVVQTSLGEDAG